MRPAILSIALAVTVMTWASNVQARTAACPCSNPCPCAPCTCGGGKSSSPKSPTNKTPTNRSGSGDNKANKPATEEGHRTTTSADHPKHHEARHEHGGHDHRDHGHSGGSVGVDVGVSADFSVIGRRTAEPDPFAAGPGPQPVGHTEFKTKAPIKPSGNNPKDPFKAVQLTGERAKEENKPAGPVNVDNDRPAPGPVINRGDDPPPTGERGKEGNSPPGMATGVDDGLPPPALTEKDCARLRNRLLALLAAYKKTLAQLDKADGALEQLEGQAWDANNKISEGYEDQSIGLIEEGRDDWKQIDKEWSPAVKQYRSDFDAAAKAHADLVQQRAAFQRMCPGVAAPEILDLPEKQKHDMPEEYGR